LREEVDTSSFSLISVLSISLCVHSPFFVSFQEVIMLLLLLEAFSPDRLCSKDRKDAGHRKQGKGHREKVKKERRIKVRRNVRIMKERP
jgi:hypothetical protein